MPERPPLIVANWKMTTSLADATILATAVRNGLEELPGCDVVLCPPFVWLVPIVELLQKAKLRHLHLGAQNMFWEDEGAYTGEVSPTMLKHLVSYVILGHSERVAHFGENEAIVNRKLKAALHHHLKPIVCVGEDRKGIDPRRTVITKLKKLLEGVGQERLQETVIAYEPVWAIGTGVFATGQQAEAVAQTIRQEFGPHPAILYGGSVDPENSLEFLLQPSINGLLIGGSSLSAPKFLKICQLASQ